MKELSIPIHTKDHFTANFLFCQSPNRSKCRFYVSVLDEESKGHFFFVEKRKEGDWKIVSAAKLPQWILELEGDFNELIPYAMDLESPPVR